MIQYTMMFSGDNGQTWETVRNFNPHDAAATTKAYSEVDKKVGLLMVVSPSGVSIFSRRTAASPHKASDD